jgi:serine protease
MRSALVGWAAAVALLAPSPAAGAPASYRPGEVIVHFHPGAGPAAQASVESRTGTAAEDILSGGSQRLVIEDGESVQETLAELRREPAVQYAVPNFTARSAGLHPNDRGFGLQWNLWGPFGINMPDAWALARRRKAPGGRGAVVAVLDTGVAYRDLGRYRRAPDLGTFAPGYDFVDLDRHPLDANGHGTHVAGTIAEGTDNRIGAAGIAYSAGIMPIRTLDRFGGGDAVTISSGIRYAVRHHADAVNLSLEFSPRLRAADVPDLLAALRYARRRGVVVTAVAGNGAGDRIPYPGRAKSVIAVGATTEHGCQADYSSFGRQLDVVAPGGGNDASPAPDDPWSVAHCHPELPGRSIYQQTFSTSLASFGLPSGYYGTSMAAPHVAGVAALLIASRRLGPRPTPAAVERHIERTARDLGPAGFDDRYGHGLIDAAAALR